MTAPAAVLVDMDGTLVDTEAAWWQASTEVASELGLELDDSEAPQVLGRSSADIALLLRSRTSTTRSVDELAAAVDARAAALIERRLIVMPGAVALLERLGAARIPVVLVSASPRCVVDHVIAELGRQHFAGSFAAEDTARTKPHPDPYLAAAAACGVEPTDCVVLEDSPTGIASAQAAGIPVVVVGPLSGLSLTDPHLLGTATLPPALPQS